MLWLLNGKGRSNIFKNEENGSIRPQTLGATLNVLATFTLKTPIFRVILRDSSQAQGF